MCSHRLESSVDCALSDTDARNRAGNNLHGQADYPAEHYDDGPDAFRIFAKDDSADRYESRQGCEKRTQGAQKLRAIYLAAGAIWSPVGLRRINSQVEPDCAADRHDDQEALGRKRGDVGPDVDCNKQSARRSGHRKPDAFEDMGSPSYAQLHRNALRWGNTWS